MSTHASETAAPDERRVNPNFITEIIDEDLASDKVKKVVTRFPPEPNGFAHIGHAWASLLSFGIAEDYEGQFNLRIDDTNPETEKMEFAEAQIRDLHWLGLDWDGRLFFASDYFDELYTMALRLVKEGKAYVDSLSEEDIQIYRGTVTEAGKESPYRNRSVEENLDLLERMRSGEFPEGAHVLRAKIDMASPNMKLRDPILYRIMHTPHYRTGDAWHIYPMYDFAHPLSDALEGVTHSLCDVGFIENRAVYDWLVDNLFDKPRPHQYEFGRRSIEYMVVSKRYLSPLVAQGVVSGWDDPRMPTLAGLRRRGVTPEALQDFASRVGVSRTSRNVDIALLEFAIRDDLNYRAKRVMGVIEPLKAIISNYPEGETEELRAPHWPKGMGKESSRPLPFSKTLYIEREDFAKVPPKGFKRLSPGEYVRLRYAYIIRCDEVIKDSEGEVSELRCSYLPNTLGNNPEGIKVRGAIHWLSAEHALPADLRLYDRLFTVPNPLEAEGEFMEYVNPESLVVKQGFVEPSVQDDPADTRYQFERLGYFWQDSEASSADALVFNRIVTLKDSWEKKEEKGKKEDRSVPIAVVHKAGEETDPVLAFSPAQKAKLDELVSLGVSRDDAVLIAENPKLTPFFEAAVRAHNNPQGIANWLVNDVRRELPDDDPERLKFSATELAELVELIDKEVINGRIAKDVLETMLETGKAPTTIVEEKGLEQVTDTSELEPIIAKLIAEDPDKVEAYRDGKTGLMGFFVGQVMRETGGKANPQLVKELLEEKLA